MKPFRLVAFSFLAVGIISVAWISGYREGDKDASERESKAWGALLASGWLDGFNHDIHRWAPIVSADQARYMADDYQSGYERFLEACAEVPEGSRAGWLIENHAQGKMKPEEF